MAREVGVEGLEDLEVNVERPVGVAGLDPPPDVAGLDAGPPADEGRLIPETAEFKPVDAPDCLGIKLLFTPGSV